MYDIAVVGLGPAGSTLARLLDPSLKVFAIDRKSPDDGDAGFRKPCGGLLASDAQKALSRYNLTLPKDVLVDPQIFAVKTIDLKQNLTRHYQRFYINLDRHKFDRWLMNMIPARVDTAFDAACQSVTRADGGFEITYAQGGQTKTVRARYVVGADGSNSIVRRDLFGNAEIRRYLSVQQFFVEEHATPFYSCIFDSDITDSYCWSISKDGYFVLGGAFPVKDGRHRFDELKRKLERHGFTFGEPVRTEACLVSRPRGLRDFRTAKDGAFLAGEAAGFISPSSLEGISYALNTAHDLADIFNTRESDPCRAYRRKTLPVRAKLLLKNLKSPFMYHPFLRNIVMSLGLNAIDVIETP